MPSEKITIPISPRGVSCARRRRRQSLSSPTNPQRILFPVQEPAGRLRAVKDLPSRRMKSNNNNLLNIHKRRKTLFVYCIIIYVYTNSRYYFFCYWPVVGDMGVRDRRHEYLFFYTFFFFLRGAKSRAKKKK